MASIGGHCRDPENSPNDTNTAGKYPAGKRL
jgi:hypothetical protein